MEAAVIRILRKIDPDLIGELEEIIIGKLIRLRILLDLLVPLIVPRRV